VVLLGLRDAPTVALCLLELGLVVLVLVPWPRHVCSEQQNMRISRCVITQNRNFRPVPHRGPCSAIRRACGADSTWATLLPLISTALTASVPTTTTQHRSWQRSQPQSRTGHRPLREFIANGATEAVIPPKRNRKIQYDYDEHAYKARHLVENAFADLKHFRGIATRYCKLASTFVSMLSLCCFVVNTRATRRGASPYG